jgi:hypothetical protein
MNEPLDELYLVWLYGQVANPNLKSSRKTYWDLMRALFTTEFVWFVPNDDARISDGIELRGEFCYDAEISEVDPHWMDQGCSFLEMMIGISRRLSFQADRSPSFWFWKLIENLGLSECNDAYKKNLPALVEEVTDQVTFRTYSADGRGGLFPLKYPEDDQTKVELWYQMQAYIMENEGR